MSDIEIAQQATMKPIVRLAQERLGIGEEHLDPYGRYKAKLSLEYIESIKDRPNGKLVLITAISPTPAGEGKTTTTVGLGDALNRLGHKAMICLREPALGPCFGVKGGAAGGGAGQCLCAAGGCVRREPAGQVRGSCGAAAGAKVRGGRGCLRFALTVVRCTRAKFLSRRSATGVRPAADPLWWSELVSM